MLKVAALFRDIFGDDDSVYILSVFRVRFTDVLLNAFIDRVSYFFYN